LTSYPDYVKLVIEFEINQEYNGGQWDIQKVYRDFGFSLITYFVWDMG
jgi:hypothetical protein